MGARYLIPTSIIAAAIIVSVTMLGIKYYDISTLVAQQQAEQAEAKARALTNALDTASRLTKGSWAK